MTLMKTARQILVDAKALIDEPHKWIKGAFARDADGNLLSSNDGFAKGVCFCASGAQ